MFTAHLPVFANSKIITPHPVPKQVSSVHLRVRKDQAIVIAMCAVAMAVVLLPTSEAAAESLGMSPVFINAYLRQDLVNGSSPVTLSGTWNPVSSGYDWTTFGATGSAVYGTPAPDVTVSVGYPGSGLDSVELTWVGGVPQSSMPTSIFVDVPANWAEEHSPGTYVIGVVHSSPPPDGGTVGASLTVEGALRIWLYGPVAAPLVAMNVSSSIVGVGEDVVIEAEASYPYDDYTRQDFLWTPDGTLEAPLSVGAVGAAMHESHRGEVEHVGDHFVPIPPSEWKITRNGEALYYRWDFDSDGTWDTEWDRNYLSDIYHLQFNELGDHLVTVQAAYHTDDAFGIAESSHMITVVPEPSTMVIFMCAWAAGVLRRKL